MSNTSILPQGFKYRDGDYLYHVVLSFRDSGTKDIMYVVKYFGKRKRWWHYEVVSASWIEDILKRQSK